MAAPTRHRSARLSRRPWQERMQLEDMLLANQVKALVAHRGAGHGLRQTRPRLRRPLPASRFGGPLR
ncbi:hypothetical protein SBA3_1120013 [Candidatus Sulfopaludibacter sp. SbA3]|nr:hypothetical protein SBA3_1120013 [Candidatus Sulfopaludibacter sp. SbA3]